MADINFKTTNLLNFTDVPKTNWILNNASWVGDVLTVQPNGSAYVDIPSALLEETSRYYKVITEFSGQLDISSNFSPKGQVYVEGGYNNSEFEDWFILLNRLSEISNSLYADNTIIETRGFKLNSVRVKVKASDTTSPLEISKIEIYQSEDVDQTTLVDVSLESVLAAEVMNTLNAWSDLLVVDSLETNINAKAKINNYEEKRDFIKIVENNIEFREEQLNEDEYEQLVLKDDQGNQYPVWYTSIGEADDAYQFVTLTDPNEFIESLSEGQRDSFKYMVRTATQNLLKMAIKFIDFENNGVTTTLPSIVMGTGTSEDPNIKDGKGYIYKDSEGMVLEYYSSIDGQVRQIKMDDDGITITPSIESGKLENLEFYTDGFVADYNDTRVSWYWTKDGSGKITQLDSNTGDTIIISHNTGNIPYV